MALIFEQVNPHACRTYLVKAEGTNEAILIDPVLDHVDNYLQLLKRENLQLVAVIDSHTHADHISGAAALKDHMDHCQYIMHEKAPARCVTKRVKDGDQIELLGTPVKVLHSPGHTRDSISLIFPDRLFTGDALFLDDGGAGRDDLPGGDPSKHYDTLKRFFELPDHLVVCPAHEYRDRKPSNLSRQKETNPHLRKATGTKKEFINYLEDLKLGPADWMKDVLKANYACARDPGAVWIPTDSPVCEVKGTLDLGVNAQIVSSISVNELKSRIDAKDAPVMIDVRESHELIGPLGKLDNVRHIPLLKLIQNLDKIKGLKHKEVVIVCRSGGRAHTASQIMQQTGFKKVKVLEGGMLVWRKIIRT